MSIPKFIGSYNPLLLFIILIPFQTPPGGLPTRLKGDWEGQISKSPPALISW